MRLLICGQRSFAAKGLEVVLRENGHEVECFSRGPESRSGSSISGDVFKMVGNPFFRDAYDAVINFIIINDNGIDDNINYMRGLAAFCRAKSVKQLLQISSISVYPNRAQYVNESTNIESDVEKKGSYASVKVAVDQYLLGLIEHSFGISYIRPGFIIADGRASSLGGILVKLPGGCGVLLGDRDTPLPLLDRSAFHNAVASIFQIGSFADVYLMFSNAGETKYSIARSSYSGPIVVIPRKLILLLARTARRCRLVSKTKYHQIDGLFKRTKFDSTRTSRLLKVSFDL